MDAKDWMKIVLTSDTFCRDLPFNRTKCYYEVTLPVDVAEAIISEKGYERHKDISGNGLPGDGLFD